MKVRAYGVCQTVAGSSARSASTGAGVCTLSHGVGILMTKRHFLGAETNAMWDHALKRPSTKSPQTMNCLGPGSNSRRERNRTGIFRPSCGSHLHSGFVEAN